MASKVNALQIWCKLQCQGYKDVEITNMTTSWRSGLAFCAIIHRYHPELIDYDSLNKDNVYENNKLAFDVGATLGIAPYLDPEDMVAMKVPDKLSVLTYVSQYCNVFSKEKPKHSTSTTPVKRLADKSLDITLEDVKKTRPAVSEVKNKGSDRTFATSDDICYICKTKVYLMERHFDSNRLYHRTCFRNMQKMEVETDDSLRSELRISKAELPKPEAPANDDESKSRLDASEVESKRNSVNFVKLVAMLEAKSSNVARNVARKVENNDSSNVREDRSKAARETNASTKQDGNSNFSNTQRSLHDDDDDASNSNKSGSQEPVSTLHSPLVPRSSYSDSMLRSNNRQGNKLSKMIRQDFDAATTTAGRADAVIAVSKSSVDDDLSDKLSSSGSDSTLKSCPSDKVMTPDLRARNAGKVVLESGPDQEEVKRKGSIQDNTSCQDSNAVLTSKSSANSYYRPTVAIAGAIVSSRTTTTPSVSRKSQPQIKALSITTTSKGDSHVDALPLSVPLMTTTVMSSSVSYSAPSCSAGDNSLTLPLSSGLDQPSITPRKSYLQKIQEHFHIEGPGPAHPTLVPVAPRAVEVGPVDGSRDVCADAKPDETPVPKPRRRTEVRHFVVNARSDEMLSSDVSIFREKVGPAPDRDPKQRSVLAARKSDSPPPRPLPPTLVRTTSAAKVLPSLVGTRSWKLPHKVDEDAKRSSLPAKDPPKVPPVKPPRLNIPEPSNPPKTELKERVQMPNSRKGAPIFDGGMSKDSMLSLVSSGATLQTEDHPLTSSTVHPPPRPSEPPSRRKILPQSKFHFESVSFDEPEPPPSKSDDEKNRILMLLKAIDEKLKVLETKGRTLEQIIRSDNDDSLSDDNMIMWFNMIDGRNELVREEADLMYRYKHLELERDQANIEAQLRSLMSIPEQQKTVVLKQKEEMFLKKLLETVGKRSHIVDSQEDDRIRYLREDEALKKRRETSLGGKHTRKT